MTLQKYAFALTFAFSSLTASLHLEAKDLGIATFTPPNGWNVVNKENLSPHVKILVVGPKIKNEMPPTMNLMIEPYDGNLKSYLIQVKKINDSHGDSWKDLGTLKTKAGEASLSQVEIRSKWGGEKLMHAIIVKNGFAYVLTATASKNEFGRFYQQFYTALRSLQIYENELDLIKNPEKRMELEQAIASVEATFSKSLNENRNVTKEQLFESSAFQNETWIPFQQALQKDFSDLGNDWQMAIIDNTKENLLKN